MSEQTEKKHQQDRDANQNVAAPASETDELTQKELDQTVGGAGAKFLLTMKLTTQTD